MSQDMPQGSVPPPAPYPGDAPPPGGNPPTADERQMAMFAHLAQLLGLAAPMLAVVGPLVIWLMKKETSRYVDWHGKESLNFVITVFVLWVIAVVLALVTCGIGAILLIPLWLYAVITPIVAGVKANDGQYWTYPLTFRLIK